MIAAQGCGEGRGHHGELIQGVFEDDDARLRRGLVSLPCRHLRSRAVFTPHGGNDITVTPRSREKARRAAEMAMATFASAGTGGHLTIESNIPLGRGMGSSTADVIASILAVLDYLGVDALPDRVMTLAVRAETACDSTLFTQQAVLFAHRDGVVIEPFKKPLPPIDVISVDLTPHAMVNTLELQPARYESAEIETFRPLRSLLRQAINTGDLRLLGRVATASARINDRFLPKPRLAEIEQIGARHGALGVQVAHSGTVAGLMFDAGGERAAESMELAAHDLRKADLEATIYCH